MRLTLFRKQLALTAIITFVFVLLGALAAFLVAEAERNSERNSERNRLRPSPWTFSARILDELGVRAQLSREDALKLLQNASDPNLGFSFNIYHANDVPEEFRDNLPTQVYEAVRIRKESFGPPAAEVVRLSGKPVAYLIVKAPQRPPPGAPPPPPHGGFGPPGFFFINFLTLLVSVIMAALLSVFILFRSMRSKAVLADQILGEMQNGNLKARFPITRLDEVGLFMRKFNQMADEIERLVERLKTTELRRTRLLQELAHDLRTPVASLKTFVETLEQRAESLKPEHRSELTSLSLKEIDYLERLVEDLLFLARVTEPSYLTQMAEVSLVEIVDEELNRMAARERASDSNIRVQRLYPDSDVRVKGDPHLLRRLFRNAFENAFSFARGEVTTEILREKDHVIVRIRDDGSGLSEEALLAYGEKRFTRVVNESAKKRLSVGLGSVIMKAVVNTHHGHLVIQNVMSASNARAGAELVISLRAH